MADFIHLHNHTDFSLLDGAQTIKAMLKRVDSLEMNAIAVTDHGNLFSAIPFYKMAKKQGIKPIIGCEMYVAIGDHKDRKTNIENNGNKRDYHHLVLLAQNQQGYLNLIQLVTKAYLKGFYYKPRTDKILLKKFNEGLIATSACLAGEVNHHASKDDYEKAKKAALDYEKIFPGRFYLEVQDHGILAEKKSHEILTRLSKELNIPLVATNDNHYAEKEHWEAHDALFCLGTSADFNDPSRRRYAPEKYYIKSEEEMCELFKHIPESIENTIRISESCQLNIPMGKLFLPTFPIPESAETNDPDKYLKSLCNQGLRQKYGTTTDSLKERLEYELGIIKKMGFAGYFLITMDFVQFARDQKIPVGPGRGSAAGSIVAYCAGITDVDPIKYNLLFERFLNPERISMPDIDIDFCVEGREKVINYIKEQYGKDSVAQIVTFGTLKAKSSIRDVGRVLGLPYGEVDRIAKLIPATPDMTLDKAMKISKDLSKVAEIDENHKKLIEYSTILEGVHRHVSTHAAGVVVSPGPLTDYVPLYKTPGTDNIATQVEMNSLEDLGLLKMDILGLRNLTVIDKTVKAIRITHDIEIEINKIDLNDKQTFHLFSEGRTVGVFQYESDGMREYLKQLKPSLIEDLIAMNALYRPGPMQNIPKFIDRKHGRKKITYIHDSLEQILKETYGIIVYQEQVIQIGSIIGGFTLAQGDQMRRAMGKKKADEMAAFKVDFVRGAEQRGITPKKATEIFDLVEKFAQYGFNKSHSTAYALIAYQTAWLKAHYPVEFMASNMNSEIDNIDEVVKLINETKHLKIDVLPPDINISFEKFRAISEERITYGLSAIKNIGYKAARLLTEARVKHGEFKTIFDITKYTEPSSIGKKCIESLILSGACNSLKGHRAQQFEGIERMLKFGQKYHEEKNSQQNSLFGEGADSSINELNLPETDPWSKEKCLQLEKSLLGFYLSGDPLEKYYVDLNEFSNINLSKSKYDSMPHTIRLGGIIFGIKKLMDKKNKQWVIINLLGRHGMAEIFVFSKTYEKVQDIISTDRAIFIQGTPSTKNEEGEIQRFVAENIIPLEEVRKRFSNNINIRFKTKQKNKNTLNTIKELIAGYTGNCGLVFNMIDSDGSCQRIRAGNIKVSYSVEFLEKLREIMDHENIWID